MLSTVDGGLSVLHITVSDMLPSYYVPTRQQFKLMRNSEAK